MSTIKLHDIVKLKAEPNSGEMVVEDIKPSQRNFPHASTENPIITVKYWDAEKLEYEYTDFYSEALIVVDRE